MHTPASRFPVELTWEGKSKRKLKTKLAGFEFGVSFIIHVVAKSELVGNASLKRCAFIDVVNLILDQSHRD